MILSARIIGILRERRRRGTVDVLPVDPEVPRAAAAALRHWMHPTQEAFFRLGPARWRATKKTRRAGATAGGVREFLARAIEQPSWRGTYATKTLKESRSRAWENDSKSGFLDVLRKEGTRAEHPTLEAWMLGGVLVEVRDAALVLDFSNGSQIEMFGADSVTRQSNKRGDAKHVFWIDEAQDFPDLEQFFDAVVIGSLTDTEGACWLTGTPGVDCAGMFFEITKEEEHERLPNWEVHTLASTHNPFFGAVIQADVGYFVQDNLGKRTGPYDTRDEAEAAAVRVRWERTAGAAMLAKSWEGDEPDFVREWLGKWVRTDARYVYPVHSVAEHVLVYAPQRLCDNPISSKHPRWYDHVAAVRDLPQAPRGVLPYQWLFGVGVDFGYWPDPFALVVFAFCYALPDVFEMFSWKMTRVNTDEQGAYMKLLWVTMDHIVSFVGDAAGKQDDFAVWQGRMNVPIDEANKKGKNTLEEFLANDIRVGRVHFRGDPPPTEKGARRVLSPLLTEMQHLVYLPGKPGKTREVDKHRKVAGVAHGDHNCDAGRYLYNDLRHYLAKPPEQRPESGSIAALEAMGEREERALEHERLNSELEYGELARYNESGGY